jgi:hypothetical protein
LAGTGSRRVRATRAGTDLGHNLYPVADMSFLAGVFYPDGHMYGQTVPSGRVPDAISGRDNPSRKKTRRNTQLPQTVTGLRSFGNQDSGIRTISWVLCLVKESGSDRPSQTELELMHAYGAERNPHDARVPSPHLRPNPYLERSFGVSDWSREG